MVIHIFGELLKAEGDPVELALYSSMILELLKAKADIDAKMEESKILERFGDFSIKDLMRREMADETGHPAEDGAGGQQRKRVPKPKGNGDRADRVESEPE